MKFRLYALWEVKKEDVVQYLPEDQDEEDDHVRTSNNIIQRILTSFHRTTNLTMQEYYNLSGEDLEEIKKRREGGLLLPVISVFNSDDCKIDEEDIRIYVGETEAGPIHAVAYSAQYVGAN